MRGTWQTQEDGRNEYTLQVRQPEWTAILRENNIREGDGGKGGEAGTRGFKDLGNQQTQK